MDGGKRQTNKEKALQTIRKRNTIYGGGELIIISGYSSICQEVETTLIFAH